MLAVGDTAPDFSLPDSSGEPISLDRLLGNGALILFFYPADFTPVCTREACLFRDAYSELAEQGVTVAGVSGDDSSSHAKFSDRYDLRYRLLADPEKRVIKAYGAIGPFEIIRRTTYLIDTTRKIRAAVRADLRLGPHKKLMQQALMAASDQRKLHS